jgi:hypothetical protein
MPINPNEILGVVSELTKDKKVRVPATVKETAKGAAYAGTGAAVGGLVLGPVGLAVGM